MKKKYLLTTLLLSVCFVAQGCQNKSSVSSSEIITSSSEESVSSEETSSSLEEISSSSIEEKPLSTFVFSDYKNVGTVQDLQAYFADTLTFDADDNGIILSPYHTLTVNDISVPVYTTRVGCGLHSFVYLLVNEDYVNLDVKVTTFKSFDKTVVLPLTTGVIADTKGDKITANLKDFGTFSFAFGDTWEWGLTIMVKQLEPFSVPEGYSVVEFEPGDYSGGGSADLGGLHLDKEKGSFALTEANTAYYFKKGHYLLHDIRIGSNCQVYFEPGTYLEDYCYYETDGSTRDGSAFMSAFYANNIKIYGNALIDFAAHVGGGPSNTGRSEFGFATVQNCIFDGMIGIDSAGWTLCFTDCTNCEISWTMLLSYKECSDGIMLSDCQDCLVHHNFCRVGDDAIEAKSTGAQGTKNLIYEYNAVWADKCRCYGCIYESNHDMENVIFRHNSVGFSLPNWTDLGCLVICMGNHKVTWHDIHFEDTEIYYARTQILSMYASGDPNKNQGGFIKNIYYKDITCYGPFFEHEQLVYIDIAQGSQMGRCYIENFNYRNAAGEMVKYVKDDVKNPSLTHIGVSHTYALSNVVVK